MNLHWKDNTINVRKGKNPGVVIMHDIANGTNN